MSTCPTPIDAAARVGTDQRVEKEQARNDEQGQTEEGSEPDQDGRNQNGRSTPKKG